MNMFYSKEIGKGKVFYSDLIPNLEHFFTTRETNVDENKDAICDYLGICENNLINPTQTHSDNIAVAEVGKLSYPQTDAIILTNYEQAVYLRFADCTPIIIYDSEANIGAVVHAGWRGTAKKIVVKTLECMQKLYNSKKESLFAVVGPAIGVCCYKVGDEVAEEIGSTVSDTNELIVRNSDSIWVDLKKINARQIVEFGVSEANIDICPYCTSCNNDLFFSYRKENGTDRRHNTVIKLKKR